MSRRGFRSLLCVAPLLAASAACAADGEAQRVEVLASAGDARRHEIVTRLVVGREDLARHGDRDLASVLQRVPGLSLARGPGRTIDVQLNGLGHGYTQLLLDGDPAPPGFDLASLAPDLVERIEVSRSAVVDQSTQAIAGSINIVLRKTARQPSDGELKLSLGGPARHPQAAGTLRLGHQHGGWRYGLTASLDRNLDREVSGLHQEAWEAAGVTTLQRQASRLSRDRRIVVGLAPSLDWKRDADTLNAEALLRWSRYASRFEERTQTLTGEPPEHATGLLDYASRASFARLRLNWKHAFADGASMQARLTGTLARRHSDAGYLGLDGADVLRQDQQVRAVADDRSLQGNGKFLSRAFDGHALALGWDAEAHHRQERRIQAERELPGATPVDLDESNAARTGRLALFAQDEWDIDERTALYLGMRWETLNTHTVPASGASVDRQFAVWSPVLQGVWRPDGERGARWRLALSRTYRAPTPVELIARRYVAVNNSPATPDTEGNPGLAPELATGIDLAWERDLAPGSFIGLNLVWRRIDDVVVEHLSQTDGTWLLRRANDGRATVAGLGADGRLRLRSHWPQAPRLDLRGHVALQRSWVQAVPGPDNRLDRQPPWTAALGGDWQAPGGQLTMGADLALKGGGVLRPQAGREVQRRGERTLDLYATWRLDARSLLRLGIQSAAHLTGQEGRRFSLPGQDWLQTLSTPGITRIQFGWEHKL